MNEHDHSNTQKDLFDALLLAETSQEMSNFLKDLCTPSELTALSERWLVCKLLEKGNLSYRDIKSITRSSLATIGRVARFLNVEQNKGYKTILNKLKDVK